MSYLCLGPAVCVEFHIWANPSDSERILITANGSSDGSAMAFAPFVIAREGLNPKVLEIFMRYSPSPFTVRDSNIVPLDFHGVGPRLTDASWWLVKIALMTGKVRGV